MATPNSQYWIDRYAQLLMTNFTKDDAYVERTKLEYEKAIRSMQRDIETFYARYAQDEQISYAEAQIQLNNAELKEHLLTLDEYIDACKRFGADPEWQSTLKYMSKRVRISRLESLITQLQQKVEILTAQHVESMTRFLEGQFTETFIQSMFILQTGAQIGYAFDIIDTKRVERILAKPWTTDGREFSERIWADRSKLVKELESTLTQMLIRGENSRATALALSERMNVSRSNAERLLRTESAFFVEEAKNESFNDFGVKKYEYVATLDNRTSRTCQALDNQVFKMSEKQIGVNSPPMHVNCRSTTIPYFKDQDYERVARSHGKTYKVPADMSYAEWQEKFVN